LVMAALSYASIWYARRTQSYLFMLMGVIYGYIAVTYWIFYWEYADGLDFTLYTFYFMASAVGVVVFLMNIKQMIGAKK
ncbi:MAG TPA: DUF2157 domain-containing protein, partial [Emticicia sp.]